MNSNAFLCGFPTVFGTYIIILDQVSKIRRFHSIPFEFQGFEYLYIHLCEFREKVRQYSINKFVPTTLLSKNIILFENTYILVKKFGRRSLRESNDSVKHYIHVYTIKKIWRGA